MSPPSGLRLSALVGALSYALDLTEGQPQGHCVRSCWIGMRLGRAIGLSDEGLSELYFTLLLKDLGCSSNAARICQLYRTDDRAFKRDFKLVDGSFPDIVRFALGHTAHDAGLFERVKVLVGALQTKEADSLELIHTRCQRGAAIARRLRFGERVADGIHGLDEHWDGTGLPDRRASKEIHLYSRIALLSQVVDVFFQHGGRASAVEEARARRGTWFDPSVVDALVALPVSDEMWERLPATDLAEAVFALTPAQFSVTVDDEYLDDIAEAFGEVVDSKSPYTSGHSARVALYTDLVALDLGISRERRRWLRRGALLHDVGKLGVSNSILDKPGKLTEEEWVSMRLHSVHTEEILSRIPPFAELAIMAGAHHERLDGKGYPRGISADQISLETRILTTADIFDAITASRPYRGATPVDKTLEIMRESIGTQLDPTCVAALARVTRELEARHAA